MLELELLRIDTFGDINFYIASQSRYFYAKDREAGNGWITRSCSCPEVNVRDRIFYVRGSDDQLDDIILKVTKEVWEDICNAMENIHMRAPVDVRDAWLATRHPGASTVVFND